jgi:micrococcal nuclease
MPLVILVTALTTSLATADHSGDLDCSDFPNQAAAQAHLRAHPWDPNRLDGNGNGIASESLPSPRDLAPVVRTLGTPGAAATGVAAASTPTPTTPVPAGTATMGAPPGGIAPAFFSDSPNGTRVLGPDTGQWLLLHWRGTPGPIAVQASACGSADSLWVNRSGRWLGFAKTAPAASDTWDLVTVEAHFVRGGSGPAQPPPQTITPGTGALVAPSQEQIGTVARIIDGDTILVQYPDNRTWTVRLIGIDTPETVAPGQPVQCYGPEASARTRYLVLSRQVTLETDPSQDTIDTFGRLLAYLWLGDTSINAQMAREGYAREYTYNTAYKYQAQFRQAEQDARAGGQGLWGACGRPS